MILRGFVKLVILFYLGLSLVGCASSPRSGKGAEAETAGASAPLRDPNKPSLFFAGGDVQQVRGTAMGAAVTQGWRIQSSSGDSLILQRNLDSATVEALAPGASRGPLPPLIEVRTDFFPRGGGVDVQLGAQVISRRGTEKETRQDYTETYRNELTHSLASLHATWQETGPRIATAMPPIGGLRDAQPTAGEGESGGQVPYPSGAAMAQANGGQDPALSPGSFGDEDVIEEDSADRGAPVEQSQAATWALPAAGAATATAAATARANTLPSSSTMAPVSPALPSTNAAPVASRALPPARPLPPLPPSQTAAVPPAKAAAPSGAPASATTRVAVNTAKPIPTMAKATAPSSLSQTSALASQPAPSKGKTVTTPLATTPLATPTTARAVPTSATSMGSKTATSPVGKTSAASLPKPEATKGAKSAQPASPPVTTAVPASKTASPAKAAGNAKVAGTTPPTSGSKAASNTQPPTASKPASGTQTASVAKSATNPKPASKAEAAPNQTASAASTPKTTAAAGGKSASPSASSSTKTANTKDSPATTAATKDK